MLSGRSLDSAQVAYQSSSVLKLVVNTWATHATLSPTRLNRCKPSLYHHDRFISSSLNTPYLAWTSSKSFPRTHLTAIATGASYGGRPTLRTDAPVLLQRKRAAKRSRQVRAYASGRCSRHCMGKGTCWMRYDIEIHLRSSLSYMRVAMRLHVSRQLTQAADRLPAGNSRQDATAVI